MSNLTESGKPKIYGTCAAGCLHEAMRKDDFTDGTFTAGHATKADRDENGLLIHTNYKRWEDGCLTYIGSKSFSQIFSDGKLSLGKISNNQALERAVAISIFVSHDEQLSDFYDRDTTLQFSCVLTGYRKVQNYDLVSNRINCPLQTIFADFGNADEFGKPFTLKHGVIGCYLKQTQDGYLELIVEDCRTTTFKVDTDSTIKEHTTNILTKSNSEYIRRVQVWFA